MRAGFGAFAQVWGDRGDLPAVAVTIVAGLANPAYLREISAVAAVV